jgi:putative FmdB family regulatory protein
MPLYSYRCPKGHRFDARKSAEDRDSNMACPYCNELARRSSATFAINWNGLSPSRGGISSLINDFANEHNRQARIEASRKRHGERG